MTKLLAIAALAVIAASGSALAADLAPPMHVPAPVAVDTSFDWSGAYLGVNGGYGWGTTSYSSPYLIPGAQNSGSTNGWLGGVTAGYNMQMDQFVLGVEGDVDYANISGSSGTLDGTGSPAVATGKINWLGTLRARAGYAVDRFMVYATGGLAVGGTDNSVTDLLHAGDDRSASGTQWGWVAGAGIEGAITDNVTAKIEYLYTDLGSSNYTFTNSAYPGEDVTASVHPTASIVRAGLNFKF